MNLNLITPSYAASSLVLDGFYEGHAVPLPSRTVLLAEDSDNLRSVMKSIVEGLGYSVVACADARIAAAAFRLHRMIDVLLTDFEMPGPSGAELARELTGIDPRLPVVIYTGSELSLELMREIRERQWVYISKPCTVSDLESTLKRLLNIRLPKAA